MKGDEPAFPSMDMNSHMGVDRLELRNPGLTKREYFADWFAIRFLIAVMVFVIVYAYFN